MLRMMIVSAIAIAPTMTMAQQPPPGGIGIYGGPDGAGQMARPVEGPGLGRGVYRPATPTGTATATGLNDVGGVPNGPNSPATDSGNAGGGGGVSPAEQ